MGIVYSCMYFFSLSAKCTKEFSYKIKSWNIVLYVVLKTKKCPQQPPSEPFLLYFWLLTSDVLFFFVWFFSCCFPSWWALLFLPSHFTFQPIDIQPMRRPLFPTTCNTAVRMLLIMKRTSLCFCFLMNVSLLDSINHYLCQIGVWC